MPMRPGLSRLRADRDPPTERPRPFAAWRVGP